MTNCNKEHHQQYGLSVHAAVTNARECQPCPPVKPQFPFPTLVTVNRGMLTRADK